MGGVYGAVSVDGSRATIGVGRCPYRRNASELAARYRRERNTQGEELRVLRSEREEWRCRSGYSADRRDGGSGKRRRGEWEVEPYVPAAEDLTSGLGAQGVGDGRTYVGGVSAYGEGLGTYACGGPGSAYGGGSGVQSGYRPGGWTLGGIRVVLVRGR